ncbi:unnamed protein product [Brassica napus]|nr:unnamed protein product [Brassica napus]
MACGLSKSLGFSSSLKKQQEGIVTILGGISSNTSSAPSLRRTFSADLSSKNWLSRNESSPMKKLHASVADEEEGSRSGFDIWAQIQEVKNQTKEEIEPDQTDVWSSILSDKKKAESSGDAVPPPYVHPLMKRASSLSEKSLEICTESLGSETGCEGFASYADAEIEKEEADLTLNVTVTKEEEEAITVPNLTPCMELPRGSGPTKKKKKKEEVVQDEFAYKPSELMYKLAPKPIGPITVHRLAHKPIGVPKTNSRWDELETKTDLSTPVVHSLPPRPRVAQLARSMKPPSTVDDTVGAACFNTCDYSWKLNNTETLGRNTKTQNYINKSIGVGNDGWINGCKERRRSLLSVEPFCIATS